MNDPPSRLVIELPGHSVPSWNALYYASKHKTANGIHDMVHRMIMKATRSLHYRPYRKPVRISMTTWRRRPIDADNIPTKLYIDGLCMAKLLLDDNTRFVTQVTTRSRKGEPRVVIVVEEV